VRHLGSQADLCLVPCRAMGAVRGLSRRVWGQRPGQPGEPRR